MQWPPETGAGLERGEAERLRRCCVDHFPDVDAHAIGELRELVDERDVDRAIDVLEQLRQLGRLRRRDLVHRVDRRAVDVGRRLRRRRIDPADDLRSRLRRPVLPAWIDTFRRHRQVEVLAHFQARALLEQRQDDLARRARPRRRLEHDDLPALEHRREAPRRALDVRQVGLALRRERGRQRDQHGVRVLRLLVVSGRDHEALVDERSEPLGGDVLDVALAAVERVDHVRLDVDEEHSLARLGERRGERHADVAGPDHGDVVLGLPASSWHGGQAYRASAMRSAAWPSP